jgi:hypothetical protein
MVRRNAGTYAIDGGLLRLGGHIENLLDFRLRGTNWGGTREVAPIAIDASGQLNQDQIAIL